jgi:hypothetical protein
MDNKVEKFIQVMNQRIKEKQEQLISYKGNSNLEFGIKMEIIGLEHSLNLFKILNDR